MTTDISNGIDNIAQSRTTKTFLQEDRRVVFYVSAPNFFVNSPARQNFSVGLKWPNKHNSFQIKRHSEMAGQADRQCTIITIQFTKANLFSSLGSLHRQYVWIIQAPQLPTLNAFRTIINQKPFTRHCVSGDGGGLYFMTFGHNFYF